MPRFDWLLLGRVRAIADPGADGGEVLVRLRVREVAVGRDRDRANIADWEAPPGVSSSADYVFRIGGFYAVVAGRSANGSFTYQGFCGSTEPLRHQRFRALIQLSRRN